MYLHHQESVEKLLEYFRPDPDVTAIILGGSVAKGLERSDSDIDAIIVVTEERYAALAAENRLDLVVTPKSMDDELTQLANVLARAMKLALHPGYPGF